MNKRSKMKWEGATPVKLPGLQKLFQKIGWLNEDLQPTAAGRAVLKELSVTKKPK